MTARRALKRLAFAVCAVLVSPWVAVTKAEQSLTHGESHFAASADFFALVPGVIGNTLRLAFYRLTLRACSLDVCFAFGSTISHPTAEIGSDVTIGAGANIGTATIGDHVLISPRVSILSGRHQHDVWDPARRITEAPPTFERVFIGANTWIGEGAIVMADVGDGCLVAAGAVVFRAAPAGRLVMGNPARVISREFSSGPAAQHAHSDVPR